MNLYQPTISGSLTVSGSVEIIGPFTMSGGSITGTASFAQNSGLLSNLDSGSFVGTGSFNSMSSSVSTRVTNIEGNYATTGSNIFLGAQTVCANITSTGTIIAQTLNVQQVTSSIVYSSGSNVFGNLLTDVQQMTGSLRVTGSNTILNVSNVGIATDRLCSRLVVETNASPNLSGWITTGTQFAASMAAGYTSLNVGAYDNGSTCRYCWIRTAFNDNAAIPADMVLLTGPSERVRIISTGITCFACQVCAPFYVFTGATPSTAASTGYIDYSSGGTRIFSVGTSGATKGTFSIYAKGADDSTIIPFSISNTGAATFLCCVGIGTASPRTTLEVRGTGNTALNTTGNLLVASGGTATQVSGSGGQIAFGAWLNGDLSKPYPMAVIKGISECSTTNYNYGALLFGTMDSNTTVQERMRINSSGNVSIATTCSFDVLTVSRNAGDNTGGITLYNSNPSGYGSALNFRVNYVGGYNSSRIHGDWYTGNTGALHFFTANTSQALVERMTIDGSGNVGIGCSNPQARLDILRGSGDNLRFIGSGASDYSDMVFNASNNTTRLGYIDWSNTQSRYNVEANIPFVVYTNATERLRIAAAGQITMACQPSFKAYYTGPNPTGTKGTWNAIDYNATEWNVGGCFNTTTDRFTAPVTGKYLFTLQLNVYGLDDTAQLQAAFYINTSYRYYFLMQNLPTGNTGDTSVSVSDILLLSAGDTVQPRVYTDGSGTFYFSNGLAWNTFSGHLLA